MAWLIVNSKQIMGIIFAGIVNVMTFIYVSATLGGVKPEIIATAGIFSLMAMTQVGFLALTAKRWLWSWVIVSFATLVVVTGILFFIPMDSIAFPSDGWRILFQLLPMLLILSIAQWYWVLRPITGRGKWWILINGLAVSLMAIFTDVYAGNAMSSIAGAIVGMIVMAFIQGAGITWIGFGAKE